MALAVPVRENRGILRCLTISLCRINHKHRSRFKGCAPCQGDWARLHIENLRDGTSQVREVMPLREKNFKGTVTYVSSGFGYVDEGVLFTGEVFRRGYRPCF